MGNSLASISGDALATASVARYLRISKDNMRALRKALLDLADPNTLTVGRQLFQIAVSRSGVRPLDGKVLNHLFTMFDEDGHDRISIQDYVGGIALLSCPCESLMQTLRHCLQAVDFDDLGEVTASQLVRLLKNINLVASSFGDYTMTTKQVHKVVDNVFDTITMISDNEDVMSHSDCVKRLVREPLVQKAALNKLKEFDCQQVSNVSSTAFTPSPIVRVTTPNTPDFTAPLPLNRPMSYPSSSNILSPRSQFSGSSALAYNNAVLAASPRSYASSGAYSARSGGTGDTTSTDGVTKWYVSPSNGRSMYGALLPTSRQPQRFFMENDDNQSTEDASEPRSRLFVDGTRLDEQSLMTDFSSHFLQPLVYMPMKHHGMSDELVSL